MIPSPPALPPHQSHGPAKILVVDDTPSSITSIRRILEDSYHVLTASTGEAGLSLAEEELPDAILLDVILPFMSGYAACERIRADSRLSAIPVVMISALDDRESRLKGLESGADDFISKPIDPLELRLRMRTITKMNRFRRLLEARQQFDLVLQASSEPVVLVDRESGSVVLENAAAAEQLSAHAVFWDAIDEHERERVTAFVRTELDAERGCVDVSVPMVTREGRGFSADWKIAVTEWDGRSTAVIAIRNATARTEAEAERRQAERQIAAIEASTGLSHDFGNHLMAIQGGIDLALGQLGPEHPVAGLLVEVENAAELAATTIVRIKDVSKGVNKLELRHLDPAATVRSLEVTIQHMVAPHHLSIVVCAPGRHIFADAHQFQQVLFNLVSNARDAIVGVGEITVRVDFKETSGTGEVSLAVRDTGCGMPRDVQARMFEPYFTTKEGRGGSGVGLATVLGIVTLQGGRIDVDSRPDEGTEITVVWPRSEPSVARLTPTSS